MDNDIRLGQHTDRANRHEIRVPWTGPGQPDPAGDPGYRASGSGTASDDHKTAAARQLTRIGHTGDRLRVQGQGPKDDPPDPAVRRPDSRRVAN